MPHSTEMSNDEAPDHQRQRRGSRLVVLWFLGLLALPTALGLGGVRSGAVENRELAEPPAFLARSVRDGSYFSELDDFMAENLPLRDVAVRGRAAVDYRVFGDSQNPRVVPGAEGWLYLRDEWQQSCPSRTPTDVLEDLAELNARHGRGTVTLLVAPDKARVHPEHLSVESELLDCTDARSVELRSLISDQPNVVDVWPAFERLAEEVTDDVDTHIYYQHDSHWTPLGRLAAIRELITHLDPTLWDESEVVATGPLEREGDLTSLMGLPWSVETTGYEIRRGLAFDDVRTNGFPTSRAIGTARVLPGRTILVGDSQMNLSNAVVRPYFEELILVGWKQIGDVEALSQLPKADRIIVERVERSLYKSFSTEMLEPLLKE